MTELHYFVEGPRINVCSSCGKEPEDECHYHASPIFAGDGYDDDDTQFEEDEDELPFDCHMGPDGLCGAAGSEDCDFECPVMLERYAAERRKAEKK